MNRMKQITESKLDSMGISFEGESRGVYEIFEGEDGLELIETGGLSVNSRCLVIAVSEETAQKWLDECDPAASGCDDTHYWLASC